MCVCVCEREREKESQKKARTTRISDIGDNVAHGTGHQGHCDIFYNVLENSQEKSKKTKQRKRQNKCSISG